MIGVVPDEVASRPRRGEHRSVASRDLAVTVDAVPRDEEGRSHPSAFELVEEARGGLEARSVVEGEGDAAATALAPAEETPAAEAVGPEVAVGGLDLVGDLVERAKRLGRERESEGRERGKESSGTNQRAGAEPKYQTALIEPLMISARP